MRKGTLRKADVWNRLVNEKFDGQSPILSPEASVKAAKRLYRKAMGDPWRGPVKVTSGNRQTWVRRGTLIVNPDQHNRPNRGLREIIHAISHYAHARLHPNDAPHSRRQAQLEGRLATHAVKSGWLDEGALEPKPRGAKEPGPKPDIVGQRYQRIANREAKWAAKLEQAKRLHAKAKREKRVYELRHGDRLK